MLVAEVLSFEGVRAECTPTWKRAMYSFPQPAGLFQSDEERRRRGPGARAARRAQGNRQSVLQIGNRF